MKRKWTSNVASMNIYTTNNTPIGHDTVLGNSTMVLFIYLFHTAHIQPAEIIEKLKRRKEEVAAAVEHRTDLLIKPD
jgi:hypothetical protein